MSGGVAPLAPALTALGGGSALMGAMWAQAHQRDAAMRASRVRLALRFPVGLEPAAAVSVLDNLSGLPPTVELVLELVAREHHVAHFLWVPGHVRVSVEAMLRGAVPSLRTHEAGAAELKSATLALKFGVPTPALMQAGDVAASSRALLTGLSTLGRAEEVAVRWALRAGRPDTRKRVEPRAPEAREIERAWRRTTARPGMQVAGLLLVRAGSPGRARVIAAHVESVVRSRRGAAGGIRITRRYRSSFAVVPKVRRGSGWLGSAELLGLVGWPAGPDVPPGVTVGAARELLASPDVPRDRGRRLFIGRDARGERAVVLSPAAATHHVVHIGPSGSGKTVQIAGGILSDIAAGHAGLFVDPKGDAVDTVAERVDPRDAPRVVVLDAGDDTRAAAGLDVLHTGDPDFAADVLVRTLRAMFPEWGIRSETFGRLGIRTLCELPNATLADLGRLFADDTYRRRAVGALSDGFLKDSWRSYEALSPGARAHVVQAPMARVMALLARPRVRRVLANPEPKLDLARLLAERRFLLVSLAPGALGDAAPLIGAAVMLATWAAIEARVALPPAGRHLVNLYIDELATVANGLPANLELLAERARGLGASLTVAMQSLGRVPEPIRSSLLQNSATLVTFRASAAEAPVIARELPGLTAEDLMALGPFEVAARVGTGAGSAVRVLTGRTEPLPPVVGLGTAIRDASAARYGTPADTTHPHQEEPPGGGLLGAERRHP